MVPALEKRVVESTWLQRLLRSSTPRRKTLGALLVLGVACFAGNGNAVQQPKPGSTPAAGDSDELEHQQMLELIKTVELNLRKIDTNLYSAAASGRGPLEKVADSGIARLITQAQTDGDAVQRDIARILELAAAHKHKGGGT